MRGWSLSLGRYFGVELRLHSLFVLLLPAVMMLSSVFSDAPFRGVALWLLLLLAVLVREVGRGLANAVMGIPVTRLVLLPTGAVPADDQTTSTPLSPTAERLLAMTGPLANFAVGITMALLMYTATSHVNLFERPWFGPMHLLRSAIWAQVLLGGLNLLPAFPLDAGMVLRGQFRRFRGQQAGSRAAAGISQGLATVLVLLGAATLNAWPIVMGVCILLSSRSEAVATMATSAADTITVAEVMLTEFTTLAASETLEEALHRSVQSLQNVFPVVRGSVVVGIISRDTLSQALRTGGNGYVQSAMTRTVDTVESDELLLPALRRVQHTPGTQLLPVMRHGGVIGIVTPGNLPQTMALLGRARRASISGTARADRNA
jgi:CBS domain-containing protein